MERAKGWIAAVPNALSTLRLLLAAAFPFLPPSWRLPVVVTGAFTDWLDGFVARRYHAQSTIGGLLDGIADKAFALSVLVTLAAAGVIAPWQVGLVVLRDVVVAGIALYVARRGDWSAFHRMPSRLAGKVTTALLFVWLIAVLIPLPEAGTFSLFVLCAVTSLVAAVDYVTQFARALKRA